MFKGETAWFSSSVGRRTKELWLENGGKRDTVDKATFLFSKDAVSADTLSVYESEAYLDEHLSVFHPKFICECVKKGDVKEVVLGKYFFPPEEIQSLARTQLQYQWDLDGGDSSDDDDDDDSSLSDSGSSTQSVAYRNMGHTAPTKQRTSARTPTKQRTSARTPTKQRTSGRTPTKQRTSGRTPTKHSPTKSPNKQQKSAEKAKNNNNYELRVNYRNKSNNQGNECSPGTSNNRNGNGQRDTRSTTRKRGIEDMSNNSMTRSRSAGRRLYSGLTAHSISKKPRSNHENSTSPVPNQTSRTQSNSPLGRQRAAEREDREYWNSIRRQNQISSKANASPSKTKSVQNVSSKSKQADEHASTSVPQIHKATQQIQHQVTDYLRLENLEQVTDELFDFIVGQNGCELVQLL